MSARSVRAYFLDDGNFAPPPPCSCIPCNSKGIKVHYSFDYAQQVHYPSDPLQPGPIYFLTPRKCTVFGVNCEALPRQVNFLTDEAGDCGKGANAVVSHIHYFFENHGLGEKEMHLHADNCTGQNKNNCMMQYLVWRTMTNRHTTITLSFLIVGHTKFSPDWCFGLFKRLFRRTKVGSLRAIAGVVNNSAQCNVAQLVSDEDGSTIVPSYEWTDFFATRMKKISGIKKYHHFRMTSTSPGSVFVRQLSDSAEVEKVKAQEYLKSDHDVMPAPGNDPKAKMVASRSSNMPHLVRELSPGQYVRDSSCLQWKSSRICSHTLVAAEMNSDLAFFLEWYNSANPEPNITSLAMSGLPAGRGRKGGIPKRQRKKSSLPPEIVVPRAATNANSTTRSFVASSPVGVASGHRLTSPPDAAHQPSQIVGSSFYNQGCRVQQQTSSMICLGSLPTSQGFSVSPISTVAYMQPQINLHGLPERQERVPSGDPSLKPPNTNPFYVRFIEGNIRMCQGCRSSLRCRDGCIPNPPYDLAAARAERRSFRDKSGTIITPQREQPAHYHLNVSCIKIASPDFVPSSLIIPPDVFPALTPVHKEYLRLVFGIQFH